MNNYMRIIINAIKQWVNDRLTAKADVNHVHDDMIKTVNGVEPDESGNVVVEVPEVEYPVTSVNGMTSDVVIDIPDAVVIDSTLSMSGQAADAKTVGDKLTEKADQTSLDTLSETVSGLPTEARVTEMINATIADIPFQNKQTVVNLPERYDIVVGDTLELFYAGIVNVGNVENFIVECACDVGEAYKRKFMYTPAADHVGNNYTFTLTVKDAYGNVLDSQETKIAVTDIVGITTQVTPSGNSGFFAQTSGVIQNHSMDMYLYEPIAIDSSMSKLRIVNGIVNPYMAQVAFANEETLTLYQSVKPVLLEGVQDTIVTCEIDIDTSYKYMYIAANTGTSGTMTPGAEYYIIYSGTNEAKTGNVLCVGDSLTTNNIWVEEFSSRLTNDGHNVTLIGTQGDSAKHEGHSGYGYGSYLASSPDNPFWNAGSGEIDFANYMDGLGLSGQTIDHCIILLGWNECSLPENDFKQNVTDFCTKLRSAYPNCEILFVGVQIPSLDGLGANYGTSWKWKQKCNFVHDLDEWYTDIAAEIGNAKTVQLCGQFDTEYNMPSATRQVNRRNNATETYGTNGLHPSEPGYLQIADAVYRGFVSGLLDT